MNIRDLEYVIAVADTGHFGRAAELCNVSQPALSVQIRKLEQRLGVTLFERTNRSVKITPIGAQIVARARELVAKGDEIIALARAARDPLSGPFRLGMIATIGPYLAPLILRAVHEAMPDLKLSLVEGMTHDLETALAAGGLDAVIQATTPALPRLAQRPLYDEAFLVALPESHPLAKGPAVSLQDIEENRLLLLADGHCLRDQVLGACSAESAQANTRETSLETLLALVAAGDGITLVPALVRKRAPAGIALLPEASGLAGRRVELVARQSFPQPEVLNILSGIIRDAVRSEGVSVVDG
ncbi:MAG: LysR substrate-binding domain-containing protein [Paracoccaceae bacterium]|nr:LysR substrate-binding domain-containing protein [Paracoccaceae bacterium]